MSFFCINLVTYNGSYLVSYLLEVTNLVGAVHKMSSLSKESVDTSSNNNSLNLTLLASGTRKDPVPGFLGDRKRLASESGLINLKRIAFQEASISRDDISQLDADHISRYQNCSLLLSPFSISQNLHIPNT